MASSIVPVGADHAPALHALVRKRAELAGDLTREQVRVRELQHAIVHIDAVLILLNPGVQVDLIQPSGRALPRHNLR